MQGVNTGKSGAPNGEQGMRTQEIHIVSSNAHRQAYVSMQNQRLQKQFEPMTFSNTPFPAEKEGHRRGKAESTPRWRFAFVASLIAIDLAVMLLSLTVSLVINGAAFDAIGRSDDHRSVLARAFAAVTMQRLTHLPTCDDIQEEGDDWRDNQRSTGQCKFENKCKAAV